MDMLGESDQAELVADGTYEIGERRRGGEEEWVVHCLVGESAVASPDERLIRRSRWKARLSSHGDAKKEAIQTA